MNLLRCLVAACCLATLAHADDTEIYGTISTTTVEPNVLIIFDTSGSMATADVPGIRYDPNVAYPGQYDRNQVYYKKKKQWYEFTGNTTNITCSTVKDKLQTKGYSENSKVKGSSPFSCDNTKSYQLRTGNYRNYLLENDPNSYRRRIDVAKDVLADIVGNTDGVRFGLMVFNYDQGGRISAACGSSKSTIVSAINNASPDGWTPLAETLAEAGLYFAGMQSWFNSGVHYTSPMQQRCQKNYIIVMTDGEPTHDRDHRLYDTAYINGDLIGDQDGDHAGPCSGFSSREYWSRDDDGNCHNYDDDGSDYLDDVAKYLHDKDCNPTMGDGTSFDKQNIVTFTIGFKSNQSLLERTAGNGGGEYYTAEAYSELKEAFDQIMSSIVEKNACYVAPVVPISRMNRVYAGDKIYLGFFKPQQSGRWIGNIKRYALETDGTLLDAQGNEVTTADGLIKENALSWWTSLGNDGPAVEKGGVAEVLSEALEAGTTRAVYTYTQTQAALTHSSNAFVTTNTAITNTMLNVASDTARQSLFTSVRNGRFGDIIHSEPAVVYYPSANKSVIYVGANDGMLHCIDDETGLEIWSFIPPEHLERLWRLDDADHDYFVDGSPVIYNGTSQKILLIGSRRGGYSYVALDITDYAAPRYLYTIGHDVLGATGEQLGQSWARPEKATVATGSTVTTSGCGVTITATKADVFLFAGGYDNNQDVATPTATDTTARAAFAVNVATGAVLGDLKFSPATHPSLGMTHSVLDVSGFDHDNDGIVSRIYFGDLGGNIFALRDDEPQTFDLCSKTITRSVVNGTWTGRKLFTSSSGSVQRKIFYAPDAVGEPYGEIIYFGTGDRENPDETAVVNRFYAIKNDWTSTTTLTESDLLDVTSDLIQLGTADQQQQVRGQLDTSRGWFIRLENPGEKIVATPRVYGGVVYVTTYTPSAGSDTGSDPCAASTARGVARLYAMDYKTGAAVHYFSHEAEADNSGNPVSLGKKDRSIAIGTAIPSAPVIAVLGGGARIFIGVEGGLVSLPTIANEDMHRFYWNRF
jgi:type IV pilus assembly protein PilY1